MILGAQRGVVAVNRPLFCSGCGVASDRVSALPSARPGGRDAPAPPSIPSATRGATPAVGTEVKNKTGNVTGGGPRTARRGGRSDVAWTRFPFLPLRLSPLLLSEMQTSSFPTVAAAGAPHGPTPLGGKAEKPLIHPGWFRGLVRSLRGSFCGLA